MMSARPHRFQHASDERSGFLRNHVRSSGERIDPVCSLITRRGESGKGMINHAWTLDDSDWIQVVRGARRRLS